MIDRAYSTQSPAVFDERKERLIFDSLAYRLRLGPQSAFIWLYMGAGYLAYLKYWTQPFQTYVFAGSFSAALLLSLVALNRALERYSEVLRAYMLANGEEVKLLMASGTYEVVRIEDVALKSVRANG